MPILETEATAKAKSNSNGSLSFFKDGTHYVHTLWITSIEQPHQITGTRKQSKHVAHWYPKSYAPGDLSVTIRNRTQRDYQRLANLVRLHHKMMTDTPGMRFSNKSGSTGRRHLMFLQIPSEDIYVRGWISTFTLTKKGVHDVAPEYTFSFFTAFDLYSSDPIISHQIREWWNPAKMKAVEDDPFVIDPEDGNPNREETTKENRRRGPD